MAERAHEVAVGDRVGGADVNGAGEGVVGEEEFDGAAEVVVVDPAHVLVAAAERAAEAEADDAAEGFKDAAVAGAEDHGGAEGDLSGVGRWCGGEGGLPFLADVDGEAVAEFAGGFVHGAVAGVAVDGGGAGVDPDAGGDLQWAIASPMSFVGTRRES